MTNAIKLNHLFGISFLAASLATAGAHAADYKAIQQLIETSKTGIGQTIRYPRGAAKITSLIITLAPGEQTGVHLHPVPTYGYVLEGAVTVDYGKAGTKTFKKGSAFMEAQLHWHNGSNKGKVPVRLLVVFIGVDGVPNVVRPPSAK